MADHRHKRDTEARRKPKALAVIGPLAVLATASAVTIGVARRRPGRLRPGAARHRRDTSPRCGRPQRVADHPRRRIASRPPRRADLPPGVHVEGRDHRRDQGRDEAAVDHRRPQHLEPAGRQGQAAGRARGRQEGPGHRSRAVGPHRDRAQGRVPLGHRRLPVRRQAARRRRRPSMEPCPDGSVESGLTDNAVYVYRSVCNAFPEITSYGGWSSHGEHASGRASTSWPATSGSAPRSPSSSARTPPSCTSST